MTQHRSRRPYSPAYARRKLASADATLAYWQAVQPRDWRERADKHQALQEWGAAVARWRAVLDPPKFEPVRLPF
jgi:hypothetical protein